jgi:hypothetical protein
VATASPHWQWKVLYEAALLECDLAKLPQGIVDAQKVITDRMQCLDGSVSEAEQRALMDAHYALCDLCRMAGISGQTMLFPK